MQLAAVLEGAKLLLYLCLGKKLLTLQLSYLNYSIKLACWSVCLVFQYLSTPLKPAAGGKPCSITCL